MFNRVLSRVSGQLMGLRARPRSAGPETPLLRLSLELAEGCAEEGGLSARDARRLTDQLRSVVLQEQHIAGWRRILDAIDALWK